MSSVWNFFEAQTTLPRNFPRDEKREEMAVFTDYRLRIPVGKLVYSYHHPCRVHIYTCNITPHYELHISVQSASQQKKNETIKVKKIKSEITNNKTLFFNMHITDFKS